MAFTASGLFVNSFHRGLGGGTPITIDINSDTVKAALYLNTITPNYTTDTGYGATPWSAGAGHEVPDTGTYAAGGSTITTPTWTAASGNATFDGDNLLWTAATITAAKGLLIYDDTVTGKLGLCGIAFPTTYSSTVGNFSVTFDSAGIFYLDLA